MSFTPPACHRPKPAPRPSSTSTWSASPTSWNSSAESSPQAGPASSSPARPATCSPRCPTEQNQALANTPAAELAQLPFLQPDAVTNSGAAYALAKRANILRVQAASVEWGDRGARLNSLSPGIIMTPLAMDELNSPAGAAYQQMIQASAAGRVGTPDEIGATAAFLMGRDGTFITGTDLLIDGGVIASIATGRYQLHLSG